MCGLILNRKSYKLKRFYGHGLPHSRFFGMSRNVFVGETLGDMPKNGFEGDYYMDTDDTKERVLAGDFAHILAMDRTKAH